MAKGNEKEKQKESQMIKRVVDKMKIKEEREVKNIYSSTAEIVNNLEL